MQPWRTLCRETILDHSPYLAVEDHTVELPDGRTIPHWPWVITPDYVNVVAVTAAGYFLYFRQSKYALGEESLAPVGGYMESDELPLHAAQRELLEETGYQASEWVDLGRYVVDGNRGCGVAYFFLARGACRVAQPQADDLEEQELLLLSRADVEAALLADGFKLLPWAAITALALFHIRP